MAGNSIADDLESLSVGDNDRKIVVGIDFGTTFSGVAWAETRRSDIQSVVEVWPANLGTREGMSSPKVPTELRYTSEGTEWGFQIPAFVDRNQWFKLGLSGQQQVTGQQKSSEQLATDYLNKIYEHLMYTLEQKLGPSILRTIPMQFCLTVPAIWSEIARGKTLNACHKAGIKSDSEILLVSEPEAAAIYTLHGLDPHGIKVGETFVLCDAGGGTVDLISYTVTELRPILKIKEAAPGSGGLCGSTFLNRAFAEFLVQKLGDDPNWDEEILEEAMERFDSVIKKQFTQADPNSVGYLIPVPGLATNKTLGIQRGRLNIKLAEIKGIFDPIVDKIIKLVKDQIKATNVPVKSVLLVGGFGQNNYLKERLRSSFSPIEVLQPPNAWTAVVRGAVMMGIAQSNPSLALVSVTSRVARKHYGVGLSVKFDEALHDSSKKYWSTKHGYYKVTVLHWFIRKGDLVEENKPVQIPFTNREFIVGETLGVDETKVWCEEESTKPPIHETNGGRVLVKLTADLSHFSKSDLALMRRHKGADGIARYELPAIIEATFSSASTKYTLLYNGERYDTVTAEYV